MTKSRRRSNSLTLEEQKLLFQHADSFGDLVLFKLATGIGCRRVDIVNIEIHNLDFKDGKMKYWEQKKRRMLEEIPILEWFEADLKRYVASLPKGQKKLFTFSDRTAYNKLQRSLKRAGINKPIGFHDLRRTAIKNWRKWNIPRKMACQISGDTIATIMDYYENYTADEMKEEIDAKAGDYNK